MHAGGQPVAGIPTRHAAELTYGAFVRDFMAPNLPVMIQVRPLSCISSQSCNLAQHKPLSHALPNMHAHDDRALQRAGGLARSGSRLMEQWTWDAFHLCSVTRRSGPPPQTGVACCQVMLSLVHALPCLPCLRGEMCLEIGDCWHGGTACATVWHETSVACTGLSKGVAPG